MSGNTNIRPTDNFDSRPIYAEMDTSSNGSASDSLLFSGGENLLEGLPLLNNTHTNSQDNGNEEADDDDSSDTEEEEELYFTAAENDQPMTTPPEVEALFIGPNGLGSSAFRSRESSHNELLRRGIPVLGAALEHTRNPDRDIHSRSQSIADRIVQRILDGSTTDQLLALRTPENMNRLLSGMTPEHQRLAADRLHADIDSEMLRRLTAPDWLTALNLKNGTRPLTESVVQWDRMNTDAGQQAVSEHLTTLTRFMRTGNLNRAERDLVSEQILTLSEAASPTRIQERRVSSRMILADAYSRNGFHAQAQDTLLDARRVNNNEATRESIDEAILQNGYDRDPDFMQRFEAAGGNRQAMQVTRAQREQFQQLMRNIKAGGGKQIPGQ